MRVAPPRPVSHSREMLRALFEETFAGYRIKRIGKVDFEDCFGPVPLVSSHELVDHPDDGLCAQGARDSHLEGLEIGVGFFLGGSTKALAREPADGLADRDRPDVGVFFN